MKVELVNCREGKVKKLNYERVGNSYRIYLGKKTDLIIERRGFLGKELKVIIIKYYKPRASPLTQRHRHGQSK